MFLYCETEENRKNINKDEGLIMNNMKHIGNLKTTQHLKNRNVGLDSVIWGFVVGVFVGGFFVMWGFCWYPETHGTHLLCISKQLVQGRNLTLEIKNTTFKLYDNNFTLIYSVDLTYGIRCLAISLPFQEHVGKSAYLPTAKIYHK